MKFSNKGQFVFGSKATLSDKIALKIKSLFGKDDTSGDPKIFGSANIEGEFNYEISLEMDVNECKQLFTEIRENADKEIELLKRIKNGLLKTAKEIREVAKEEIPEWQKIMHEADIQTVKNDSDLNNVRNEMNANS